MASYLFAYLAYFGSELSLILPLILLLYEIFLNQKRAKAWPQIIKSQRYYWWGIVLYFVLRSTFMPNKAPLSPMFNEIGLILLNFTLIFWYFRLLLWPNPLPINQPLGSGLTAFSREDMPGIIPTSQLLNLNSGLGALLLGFLIWVILKLKTNLPTAAFFLAGALISLIPVLQWFPT
jgi:hypothetical protein